MAAIVLIMVGEITHVIIIVEEHQKQQQMMQP
ncbi:Uncharacterised protein [Serratia entomophila]|nr:Uncharacterised protein [Serratia entomophila]CAI0797213.1 Uncharacterised protein [Serratia entomophila]CAI0797537.1 Uncharacterised protein [Serratia entomophila]CAI0798133.1 Uncharacterised protein [Serratia entomophila]CAI1550120.1 Uncharacterised protein [Serratia entomophila]